MANISIYKLESYFVRFHFTRLGLAPINRVKRGTIVHDIEQPLSSDTICLTSFASEYSQYTCRDNRSQVTPKNKDDSPLSSTSSSSLPPPSLSLSSFPPPLSQSLLLMLLSTSLFFSFFSSSSFSSLLFLPPPCPLSLFLPRHPSPSLSLKRRRHRERRGWREWRRRNERRKT